MYNGIGLTTARGSATSGHVSKNLSYVKPDFFRSRVDHNQKSGGGSDRKFGIKLKTNSSVLEHNRKHALEAEIYELQEKLREDEQSETEIELAVQSLRSEQQRRNAQVISLDDSSRSRGNGTIRGKTTNSHEINARKEEENRRLRSAFGLSDNFKEGDSFDPAAQERRREERLQEKERYREERQRKKEQWEQRQLQRERDRAYREEEQREREHSRTARLDRSAREQDERHSRFIRRRRRSPSEEGEQRDRKKFQRSYRTESKFEDQSSRSKQCRSEPLENDRVEQLCDEVNRRDRPTRWGAKIGDTIAKTENSEDNVAQSKNVVMENVEIQKKRTRHSSRSPSESSHSISTSSNESSRSSSESESDSDSRSARSSGSSSYNSTQMKRARNRVLDK